MYNVMRSTPTYIFVHFFLRRSTRASVIHVLLSNLTY